MRFEEWEPTYRAILQDFGFDPAQDEQAANDLARSLARPGYDASAVWSQVAERIRGKTATILGAADDAAQLLRRLGDVHPLVAADGATTAALEAGLVPDLIVTDLDGRLPDEVAAAGRGSLVAIHAHGDNRPALAEWVPKFPPARVAGTCQCRPVPPLRNEGGFTDGDRAAHLAHALGAARLRLVAFDFQRIGAYTGRHDPHTKPRKLAWARRLLDSLERRGAVIEGLPR